MKVQFTQLLVALAVVFGCCAAQLSAETYSYRVDLTTPRFVDPDSMTQNLNDINWTCSYEKGSPFTNFFCYIPADDGDADWGYEFGSGSNKLNRLTIQTSDFSGLIKRVKVVTDSGNGTEFGYVMNVMVGDNVYTQTSAAKSDAFTSTRWEYVYEGNEVGTLTFEWTSINRANTHLNYIEVETEALPLCAVPVIAPADSVITPQVPVSISCATDGAVVRYTLDGTDPNAESAVYESPITLPLGGAIVVKAVAMAERYTTSDVVSKTYKVIPQEGDRGSKSRPFTVDATIAMAKDAAMPEIWVKGFIVGSLVGNDAIFASDELAMGDILIADEASETDIVSCVVVKRPVTRAITIGPQHYQTVAHLHGTLTVENGMPCLTAIDELDTPQYTGIDAVEVAADEVQKEYYTLTGVKVTADKLVPGVYICKQGKTGYKVIIK